MAVINFKARKRWEGLPKALREKLLANAFCLNCEEPEFADDYIIEECGDGGLIIKGNCKYCNEPLSRIVEKEWWEK